LRGSWRERECRKTADGFLFQRNVP
jgi:hypothetical protein